MIPVFNRKGAILVNRISLSNAYYCWGYKDMGTLLDFLFPPRCLLCGDTCHLLSKQYLCDACLGDLRLNSSACACCAVPLDAAGAYEEGHVCGKCLTAPPVFDKCWSPLVYAQPLEWMIRQFKFNDKLVYGAFFASFMIRCLPAFKSDDMPDAIIPMPLHRHRLKQRGFNQSLIIARALVQATGIQVDDKSCRRVRDTEHQTGKNSRERKLNIKGAFEFENHRNYKYLIILDDVVTTGASVSELSKVLKRAGVARVDVWSLARAEKNN